MTADLAMISIAAGHVTLTDRRTRRRWVAEFGAYDIAAVQVTQELYAAVTGCWPSTIHDRRLPVVNVSWPEAVRFCNAASRRDGLRPAYALTSGDEDVVWDVAADGYRLPTEAEWEYACRAGTSRPRYGPLDDIAWYRHNSSERVHDVGGKRPNAWGLYDTLGNVWEWCWDIYDAETYGSYRVLRGGGWFDEHWSCQAGKPILLSQSSPGRLPCSVLAGCPVRAIGSPAFQALSSLDFEHLCG